MTLINSKEIVFINKDGDIRIRIPEFDTNKTYKIHQHVQKYKSKTYSSSAKFFLTLDNPEEVIGKYLLEKEEDDIFLVKCEN